MNQDSIAFLLGIGAAIFYLAWYAYVLFLVINSAAFTQKQKLSQCVFATIAPVFGLIVVHWFVTAGTSDNPAPDKEHIRQDSTPPGVTKVNW